MYERDSLCPHDYLPEHDSAYDQDCNVPRTPEPSPSLIQHPNVFDYDRHPLENSSWVRQYRSAFTEMVRGGLNRDAPTVISDCIRTEKQSPTVGQKVVSFLRGAFSRYSNPSSCDLPIYSCKAAPSVVLCRKQESEHKSKSSHVNSGRKRGEQKECNQALYSSRCQTEDPRSTYVNNLPIQQCNSQSSIIRPSALISSTAETEWPSNNERTKRRTKRFSLHPSTFNAPAELLRSTKDHDPSTSSISSMFDSFSESQNFVNSSRNYLATSPQLHGDVAYKTPSEKSNSDEVTIRQNSSRESKLDRQCLKYLKSEAVCGCHRRSGDNKHSNRTRTIINSRKISGSPNSFTEVRKKVTFELKNSKSVPYIPIKDHIDKTSARSVLDRPRSCPQGEFGRLHSILKRSAVSTNSSLRHKPTRSASSSPFDGSTTHISRSQERSHRSCSTHQQDKRHSRLVSDLTQIYHSYAAPYQISRELLDHVCHDQVTEIVRGLLGCGAQWMKDETPEDQFSFTVQSGSSSGGSTPIQSFSNQLLDLVPSKDKVVTSTAVPDVGNMTSEIVSSVSSGQRTECGQNTLSDLSTVNRLINCGVQMDGLLSPNVHSSSMPSDCIEMISVHSDQSVFANFHATQTGILKPTYIEPSVQSPLASTSVPYIYDPHPILNEPVVEQYSTKNLTTSDRSMDSQPVPYPGHAEQVSEQPKIDENNQSSTIQIDSGKIGSINLDQIDKGIMMISPTLTTKFDNHELNGWTRAKLIVLENAPYLNDSINANSTTMLFQCPVSTTFTQTDISIFSPNITPCTYQEVRKADNSSTWVTSVVPLVNTPPADRFQSHPESPVGMKDDQPTSLSDGVWDPSSNQASTKAVTYRQSNIWQPPSIVNSESTSVDMLPCCSLNKSGETNLSEHDSSNGKTCKSYSSTGCQSWDEFGEPNISFSLQDRMRMSRTHHPSSYDADSSSPCSSPCSSSSSDLCTPSVTRPSSAIRSKPCIGERNRFKKNCSQNLFNQFKVRPNFIPPRPATSSSYVRTNSRKSSRTPRCGCNEAYLVGFKESGSSFRTMRMRPSSTKSEELKSPSSYRSMSSLSLRHAPRSNPLPRTFRQGSFSSLNKNSGSRTSSGLSGRESTPCRMRNSRSSRGWRLPDPMFGSRSPRSPINDNLLRHTFASLQKVRTKQSVPNTSHIRPSIMFSRY